MALNQEQRLRAHAASLFDCFLIAATAPFVQAGKEAAQKYSEAVKKHGKGHPYGAPHPHIAMEAFKAMAENAQEQRQRGRST